jgi:hypothetical protein
MTVCLDREHPIANGSSVYIMTATHDYFTKIPKRLAGCKYFNSKN